MAKKRKAYFWQKGKTRWFWVPLKDQQQVTNSEQYCDEFEDCKMIDDGFDWSSIKEDDDLIIFGHGGPNDHDRIYGRPASGNTVSLTCEELANLVKSKLTDTKLAIQIKLYVCYGADGGKNSIAGKFFSFLKGSGYKKIKVAGYHGASVTWREDGDVQKMGKLVKVDGVHVKGGFQKKVSDGTDDYVSASSHRVWFTDNLFGTRWL